MLSTTPGVLSQKSSARNSPQGPSPVPSLWALLSHLQGVQCNKQRRRLGLGMYAQPLGV